MRLYANENIFRDTIAQLRARGHGVRAIVEEQPGAKDEYVLKTAREDGRVLITSDKDYGDLIFRDGLPSPKGLILLRFDPVTVDEATGILEMVLSAEDVEIEGWFSIVTRDSLRQRRLP